MNLLGVAELMVVVSSPFLVEWQWEPGLNGSGQGTARLPAFLLQHRLPTLGGGDFAPWGELAVRGDIFGHQNWGSVCSIQRVGSRNVAKRPTMHWAVPLTEKHYLVPNVSNTAVEKSCHVILLNSELEAKDAGELGLRSEVQRGTVTCSRLHRYLGHNRGFLLIIEML